MRLSWSIGIVLIVCAGLAHANEPEKPKKITPEKARGHIGEHVVVTFTVKSAKDAKHREVYFLDSETDFNDEKNLGIRIPYALSNEFANENITDIANHFLNKKIRATGKIEENEGRPYLILEKAADLKVVEE